MIRRERELDLARVAKLVKRIDEQPQRTVEPQDVVVLLA
jgi:hypothetical protein